MRSGFRKSDSQPNDVRSSPQKSQTSAPVRLHEFSNCSNPDYCSLGMGILTRSASEERFDVTCVS